MRFARVSGIFGIVAALALATTPALARENGAPARALGMGDAVRALGMGTSGLYFNPAGMAQTMSYAIDLGYGYKSFANGHNGHLSFVDSKTNQELAGGAGYSYSYADKGGMNTQTHDLRFAVASQFRSKSIQFCYGGGFRYMKVEQDASGGINDLNKWAPSMDLGVLVGFNDLFYIGVAAQNIITMQKVKGGANLLVRRPIAPRSVGIGLGINYSILHFGVDVDLDLESKGTNTVTPSPMAGLELTLAQMIALRAGFVWDRVGTFDHTQMRISAGLGYVSKYVGVDVGYAHDVTHVSDWMIESSFRVFLP
jgi:hypothetical protein